MRRLTEEEIARDLAGLAWHREDDALVYERKLADFGAAMAFVNRVAEAAEGAGHHPDILVHGWNKVRLTLSTHSAGGLTASDFDLARMLQELD